MTQRRVRQVCVATIATASVGVLPGTAAAHCVGPEGLTASPTAERLDWSNGCDAVQSFGVAPAVSAAPPSLGGGGFKQVGRNPLMRRGMHAAIAIGGDYAYIGSRTDKHEGTPHGGVLVVDISDPSEPELLGQPIAPLPGESTRELRVWRSQNVLIVLNTNCGVGDTLHHCTVPSVSNIRFYDIGGRNAKAPRLLARAQGRHARVLPVGGPQEPEARADLRRQRRPGPRLRHARRRPELPVLGLGHLRRSARASRRRRSTADRTATPRPPTSPAAACTP